MTETYDDGRLARHSNQIAFGIVISRMFGILREALLAVFLGTGAAADAFRAALRIPNLLQNLLGEGVLSASFIPVYARLRDEGRDKEAGALAGATAAFLVVIVTAVVLVGVLLAEPLARALTPGFAVGTPRFDLTVTLVRIMFPGVGLLVLAAWCLGVLNAHRQFFITYVAPVFWNLAIIASITSVSLVGATEMSVAHAAAVGTVIGAFLQFVVQLPRVRRYATHLVFRLSFTVTGFRDVVTRFGTVVAGRGSVQLASYVELAVASLLAAGTLAALGYAQVLYLLPISVFGLSVAAAELPELAGRHSHSIATAQRNVARALGRVGFFVVPSAIAFMVAGDRIVALVFQGVRFTPDDVRHVGLILSVYALALLAATSSRVLQSVLYAVGDVKRPALYALVRVSVGLGVALLLIFPLDAFQITSQGIMQARDAAFAVTPETERAVLDSLRRLGVLGLVAGSVIGAWLEYLLLRRRVVRLGVAVRIGGDSRRSLIYAGLTMAVVGVAARLTVLPLNVDGKFAGIWLLFVLGGAYLTIAARLGSVDAARLLRLTRRRSN